MLEVIRAFSEPDIEGESYFLEAMTRVKWIAIQKS
jgi:hypothetical protein